MHMKVSLSVFRKRMAWGSLTAIGVLLLIVVMMFWERRGYSVDYGLENYIDIMSRWTYEDGRKADLSSLRHEAGEVTVCYMIPDMDGNTTLSYRSHNMYTKVFLEDELIYETDNTYSDRPPGTRWNLVTLKPEQAGQMLRIQIKAAYSGDSPQLDNIYWGDRAAIVLSLIRQKMWAVLICVTICLCGIFMIILDIAINYKKKGKNHGIRWLGAYALCIGGWSLIETNILQLLIKDTQILQPVNNILLILSVMPMLLYADCTYGIFKYLPARLLGMLQLLFLVICIVLPVAKVVDWHGLLPVTRMFMAVCAVGFIVLSIWRNRFLFVRKENRTTSAYLQMTGIVVLCVTAVLELLRYNISGAMDRAMLLRFGLLIFIICFALSSMLQTYILITQGMEYNSVHKLAYSDALTQVGNRVAFLEGLKECVDEHIQNLGIVYFDVNNLKKVNDVHGHEQGDVLIRTAANVIRDSFGPHGRVYRIGGDEFCVLLDHDPIDRYAQAVIEFKNRIKSVNESGNYIFKLQIAHGFACCEADSMETVDDAVKTADEKMYRDKIQLKKES